MRTACEGLDSPILVPRPTSTRRCSSSDCLHRGRLSKKAPKVTFQLATYLFSSHVDDMQMSLLNVGSPMAGFRLKAHGC